MMLTDEEILREYREAADPRHQVEILADKNCCGVWEMANWLKNRGEKINLQWFFKENPKNKERIRKAMEAKKAVPEATEPAEQDGEPVDDIFATLIRLENKLKLMRRKIKELEAII